MVKKKFILFLGVGWSGTTSLFYTLQNNLQYLHGGYVKEPYYLSRYFLNGNEMCVADNFNKILNLHTLLQNNTWYNKHNNIKLFADPLLKMGLSSPEFLDYFTKEIKLESYVKYYRKLAEYSKDYQAVGDFSNPNRKLTKEMLSEVLNSLIPYFDVKALIIFRDPVRRLWSMMSSFSQNNKRSWNSLGYKMSESEYEVYSSAENITHRIKCRQDIIPYTDTIKNAYNALGKDNVHYIIMEDFFSQKEDNPEVSKLEKFLGISIPSEKIHPCCYVPDRGINVPNIPGLEDQSSSDHVVLTEETYYDLRYSENIIDSYNLFENFHGYLPADWGSPINYGY